jgi:hypothetical protein
MIFARVYISSTESEVVGKQPQFVKDGQIISYERAD